MSKRIWTYLRWAVCGICRQLSDNGRSVSSPSKRMAGQAKSGNEEVHQEGGRITGRNRVRAAAGRKSDKPGMKGTGISIRILGAKKMADFCVRRNYLLLRHLPPHQILLGKGP